MVEVCAGDKCGVILYYYIYITHVHILYFSILLLFFLLQSSPLFSSPLILNLPIYLKNTRFPIFIFPSSVHPHPIILFTSFPSFLIHLPSPLSNLFHSLISWCIKGILSILGYLCSVSGGNTHSDLFSSIFHRSQSLTPHVLSEWMVEVCRSLSVSVRVWWVNLDRSYII
jgi:hypothetical protein